MSPEEKWGTTVAAVQPPTTTTTTTTSSGDSLARLEGAALTEEATRESIRETKERREQRAIWAGRVYGVGIGWLVTGLACVVLRAVRPDAFYLSDAVLIAIISGGAVNVLGILAIIVRYLFPSGK